MLCARADDDARRCRSFGERVPLRTDSGSDVRLLLMPSRSGIPAAQVDEKDELPPLYAHAADDVVLLITGGSNDTRRLRDLERLCAYPKDAPEMVRGEVSGCSAGGSSMSSWRRRTADPSSERET